MAKLETCEMHHGEGATAAPSRDKTQGEITMAVLRYLAHVAEMGESAPTHQQIGVALGVSPRAILDAIKKLVTIGLIQCRIDGSDFTRRCYRIVATGYETRGYGLGVAMDGLDPVAAAKLRVIDAIERAAIEGAQMGVVRLARAAHLSRVNFVRRAQELAREGEIEICRPASSPVAFAYRVVGSGLATIGFVGGTPVDPTIFDGLETVPPPRKPRRSAQKKRKCMACGGEFTSFGPGNRLCGVHRNGSDGLPSYRIAL